MGYVLRLPRVAVQSEVIDLFFDGLSLSRSYHVRSCMEGSCGGKEYPSIAPRLAASFSPRLIDWGAAGDTILTYPSSEGREPR